VEYGDGLSWLRGTPDGSLGGVSLIQVVEHLSAQELVDLVALAARKLRPQGKIVVETVNPQSLYVFAHSFYLDPTHVAPIHPAYLHFMFKEAGFSSVEIEWRSPPPADDVLQRIDGDAGVARQVNANVDRLNQLLFAAQDYALIAIR
jgi:O-antigen chain-terminating methyltransferase